MHSRALARCPLRLDRLSRGSQPLGFDSLAPARLICCPRRLDRLPRCWPRGDVDSLAPARSAERLPVYVAASQLAPFSYGMRRSAAPCSSRTHKCKNPDELNSPGFLVLATSYSRAAYRRTTIGAAAFHFRVRNGNGWGHCARVTRGLVTIADL